VFLGFIGGILIHSNDHSAHCFLIYQFPVNKASMPDLHVS